MKNISNFLIVSLVSIISLNSYGQTALNFDGVDDVVSAEALLSATNNFTYEAWVYPRDTHEVDAESISGYGGLSGQKFLVWPTNGNISYGAGHSCSGISVGTNGISVYEHAAGYIPPLLSVQIPINGWNHIAVVCNNKLYSLYLNGFLIKVGQVSPKDSVHPGIGYQNLGIGGGSYGHYNGDLDNFRVWDYARSQAEIIADMKKCLTGNEPGLLTYYDFEDGTPSTIATDVTGNNTATLINMDPNTDWIYGISCNALYDLDVSPDSTEICEGDSLVVALDSSEVGVFYYLRDDTTSEIIDGPLVGNGDSLFFNTGQINSNVSYNVYSVVDNGVNLPLSNDHIRFNNPFYTYTDQITIESWVNFNSGEHPWAGQSSAAVDNMGQNVWLWHAGVFYINDGGTWRNLAFPSLPAGWTHVATVADTSGLYIYYDGVLVDSSVVGISNGIVNNSNSIIDLGHDPRYSAGAANRNTTTAFDDFRVWNVARTQAAISANMELCTFFGNTSLVQHTTFDEGTGTAITSLVGSNGDIMNADSNWVLGAEGCPNYAIQLTESVDVEVNYPTEATDTIIACDSITWIDGLTYIASNDSAQFILMNAKGCDSVVTLNLTINYSNVVTIDTTIMEGEEYTVDSNTYTVNGTYHDTLINVNGCDSIVVSNLSVTPDGLFSGLANSLKIYPNPAKNEVYLVGTKGLELAQVQILNAIGQDITGRINLTQIEKGIKLEIDELESGVYYINTGGIVNQLIVEK